ncbi:MAG: response regulator [Thiotrichaceae bacterium]|nr:response regulator [Thiotrichaceae bacterium]
MLSAELLEDLHTKVANDAYTLYEALAVFADDNASESAVSQAIAQCSDYVQGIHTIAEKMHLVGLQAVCDLTQQYLQALHGQDSAHRNAVCSEIERFPRLVARYLQLPNDSYSRDKLINHLQLITELHNGHLKKSANEPQWDQLSSLLAQDFQSSDKSPTVPESLPVENLESDSAELENQVLLTDELLLLDDEDFNADLPQLSEAEQVLDEQSFDEFTEAVTFLPELHSAENKLGEVVEIETPVAMAVQLPSLPDHELEQLLDEQAFDSVSEVPKIADDLALSESVLADDDEELLNEVEEIEVPEMPLEEAMQALQVMDNRGSSHFTATPESKPVTEEASLELLQESKELSNKILAMDEILSTSLHKYVTSEDNSEVFLESLEAYTNTIQSLWVAAGEKGLTGLQDVCTFINENIFELSIRFQSDRFAAYEQLAVLPRLILDYLQTPENSASTLINHLETSFWFIPLTESKALLTRLTQELNTLRYVNRAESDTEKYLEVLPESVEEIPPATSELLELSEPPAMLSDDDMDLLANSSLEAIEELALEDELEELPESVAELEATDEEIVALSSLETSEVVHEAVSAELFASEVVEDLNDFEHEPVFVDAFETSELSEDEALFASEVVENSESLSTETEPAELIAELEAFEEDDSVITETADRELAAAENLATIHNLDESLEEIAEDDTLLDEEELDTLEAMEQAELDDNLEEIASEAELSEVEEFTAFSEEVTETTASNTFDAELEEDAPFVSTDILDSLTAEISEASAELSKALQKFSLAEDDSAALLEAVEQYTDNVQSIWNAADSVELTSIQEICTFLNDNIFELSAHPVAIRRSAQPQLEAVPSLILAYLHKPLETAPKITQLLSRPSWSFPLDDERAQTLLQQLSLGKLGNDEVEAEILIEESEAFAETEELTEEFLPDEAVAEIVPEDLPEKFSVDEFEEAEFEEVNEAENLLETSEAIEEETALESEEFPIEIDEPEIVLADADILDLIIGQIADIGDALTPIAESLLQAEDGSETILAAVEGYTENVQGIWDAAEMAQLGGVQDVCMFINDNVMGLSMQDQLTRQQAQPVLALWTGALIDYLQAPREGAVQLIELLQNPVWAMPLEDSTALQARLLPAPTAPQAAENTVETELPEIVLAAPDILDLIIGQLVDTGDSLAPVLESLINAEEGSESVLTAVETYNENVQSVWDAAEMAQLGGVQDVCTFINDNVMGLSMQDAPTRQAAQALFANWTNVVVGYLKAPRSGATELVQFLQDPLWAMPLEESAAQTLLSRLLPSNTAATQTTSAAPVATIRLADPDILELVISQITDVAEELSKALEVCVSMENENPAFLEAIENYTNHVQAIWDAAEMAGLNGLQDVCTFVNDNLMAFSALDGTERQAAQQVIQQWPQLVLSYLHDPLNGAPALVAHLQQSEWAMPLEAERAGEFLSALTNSSNSPEQVAAFEAEAAATEEEEYYDADEEAGEISELDTSSVGGDISLGNAEVLEILSSELESVKEELAEELGKFTSLANGAAGFEEAAESYGDHVQRLNAAADMLGLTGLSEVCLFIANNVKALAAQDLGARSKAKKLLEEWPDLVLAYISSPMDTVIKLVNHFREPQWAKSLSDDDAHKLLNILTQGASEESEADQEPAYSRQTQATPEDVFLQIPDDVNRDLLDAYLQETPQTASDFSACIQGIIQNPDFEEVKRAQRLAHTLKGSSNILGIKAIANVAHHLEDILEYFAGNKVVPPKALTDTMVEAADCLEIMVDALMGQDDPPPQAQQVLQDVLDWANRIDKGNLDGATPAPRAAAPAGNAPVAAKAAADAPAKTGGAAAAKPVAPGDASPEQVLRVPTKTIDNLMRLIGELSISVGQIQERLKHVINSTRVLNDQGMILQQKTFSLETLVDVRGITGVESRYGKTVDAEEHFDPLEFEEYNELHSVAHSFIESIADTREVGMSIHGDLAALETMFIQQERLNKEFQAVVTSTRMVPVNTVVSKLQRNVRQTCRTTNKEAELEVSGMDILMDSDVLNNLSDPLMHILRNSIDHGLEAADERELLGKPRSGTIKLDFYREGNNIVVSCKDDGQGLNYTNIRYTAIQRGLLKENQEVTETELARMILMSGFSTKSGVTQVSGRGVGMDVVHSNIRQMKGTIDLMSETGKGMTILLKLPMSLVTEHVLLVRLGHNQFGIPSNSIVQALAPNLAEFHKVGDEITLKIGKNTYALKALANLLSVPSDAQGIDGYAVRPIVLVRQETGTTAIIVDELIDSRDLVMKTMGKYIKKVHGIAGAAILGDGSVMPLLDVPELLRSPMQAALSSYNEEAEASGEGSLAVRASAPKIMIVDDSLSVRKSLSILVEDAGFDILLAKDGLEAIEVMNQTRPNVMLVDMEMPRMNGLELTAHVRANQATHKIPIFMITSRTTEKHREQAKTAGVTAYLTKPYQDVELLGLIDKALAGKL